MHNFTLIDKTTTLVGKRCSGKSNLLKFLVSCERNAFDKIFCICPTEPINRYYNLQISMMSNKLTLTEINILGGSPSEAFLINFTISLITSISLVMLPC